MLSSANYILTRFGGLTSIRFGNFHWRLNFTIGLFTVMGRGCAVCEFEFSGDFCKPLPVTSCLLIPFFAR